ETASGLLFQGVGIIETGDGASLAPDDAVKLRTDLVVRAGADVVAGAAAGEHLLAVCRGVGYSPRQANRSGAQNRQAQSPSHCSRSLPGHGHLSKPAAGNQGSMRSWPADVALAHMLAGGGDGPRVLAGPLRSGPLGGELSQVQALVPIGL